MKEKIEEDIKFKKKLKNMKRNHLQNIIKEDLEQILIMLRKKKKKNIFLQKNIIDFKKKKKMSQNQTKMSFKKKLL